jgi:hypothetical protein
MDASHGKVLAHDLEMGPSVGTQQTFGNHEPFLALPASQQGAILSAKDTLNARTDTSPGKANIASCELWAGRHWSSIGSDLDIP